jgi:MFS transporter, VNT family, synaptic vesicle glycoprotein 2
MFLGYNPCYYEINHFIAIALPVFQETFEVPIPWLFLVYRPWRLLLQIVSLPGVIGSFAIVFYHESPKFLLSKGKEDEAIAALQSIFSSNTGKSKADFPVSLIFFLLHDN